MKKGDRVSGTEGIQPEGKKSKHPRMPWNRKYIVNTVKKKRRGKVFKEEVVVENTIAKHASRKDLEKSENRRELVWWFAAPLILVLLIRVFVLGLYKIPSGSMETTLNIGDRVVAISTHNLLQVYRGDVVTFTDPGGWMPDRGNGTLVKRVAAVGGDTISCEGVGKPLKLNGKVVSEPWRREGTVASEVQFKVTVPKGYIFVMGDNRQHSADSRYHLDKNHGLVPLSKVQGIVFFKYIGDDWGLLKDYRH